MFFHMIFCIPGSKPEGVLNLHILPYPCIIHFIPPILSNSSCRILSFIPLAVWNGYHRESCHVNDVEAKYSVKAPAQVRVIGLCDSKKKQWEEEDKKERIRRGEQ